MLCWFEYVEAHDGFRQFFFCLCICCRCFDSNKHSFGFQNDMHYSGNSLDSIACSIITRSLIHATRLEHINVHVNYFDWKVAGLPEPPREFLSQWADTMETNCCRLAVSLSYVRRFEAYCKIVCFNRSRMINMMSSIHPIRLASPVLQLCIYPTAGSAEAEHMPRLTHAQQQLLLCTASHACHLAHALLMPSIGHRFNKDRRKVLLQRMFDEVMVRRLVMLGWQYK
jgi:hypothetical protein